MTPQKDKETNRDPTTVYPENSPRLARAYRIFGPGHNELETLENLKNDMFVRGTPGQGETWLTPLGQEIERSLSVGVAEILEAYATYKSEIERMNRVEQIHKKRKEAHLSGGGEGGGRGEDENEDQAEGSSGGFVVQVGANGKIRGVPHDWAEGEDPYEQFWRDPALWLTRAEALSKTRAMRSSIAEMSTTMRGVQRFYNQKMTADRDLGRAVAKSAAHLEHLTLYAEKIEEVITMHAGLSRGTTWESRDQPGVTFGPAVPRAIHLVCELDGRVDEMGPVAAACERTRARLASTRLLTTARELRVDLRVKLERFAALCLPEEARDAFKEALQEELKQ